MPHDLVTALSKLPDAYAEALRLRVAGATPEEVGRELGLDPAAVGPLLTVAEAKLRGVLMAEGDATTAL